MIHTMLGDACNRCKRLVILAALASATAHGSEPACAGPGYRAFDFWLGRWQVTLADGRVAGHNIIEAEPGGCALLERWRSAAGGAGVSLNFYDPAADVWRQIWVSPGFHIDISGGPRSDGMVMEGHIRYRADARLLRFRGTWTPLPDGRVRQFFEEQVPAGEWVPWFEGFYQRAEGAAGP